MIKSLNKRKAKTPNYILESEITYKIETRSKLKIREKRKNDYV